MTRKKFEYTNVFSGVDLFRTPELPQVGGPVVDDSKSDVESVAIVAHTNFGEYAAIAFSNDVVAHSNSGTVNEPSAQDVAFFDAIGATTLPATVVTSGLGIANGSGDLDTGEAGTLTFGTSQVVTISSETPLPTWNHSGTATYEDGLGTAAVASSYVAVQAQNTVEPQAFNLGGPSTDLVAASGNSSNFSGATTNSAGVVQVEAATAVASPSVQTAVTNASGQVTTLSQGGLIINIIYDSSANSAPAAFKTAISYVVNLLEATFTDPVTINIDVGWGEVGGQALGGALGASIRAAAPAYTYSQVRNALISDGNSSVDATAVASLPGSDPTNGGNFDIGTAVAKALGLLSPTANGADGWIGFTNIVNTFTFDPNNRAVPGQYDFIGVALHEISEVMGRVAWLGNFIDYANAYSVMDLFRYSAPGVHRLVGGQSAYFSIDGGQTNLDNFNTNANGDFGDWAASAGNDAFLAFSNSGVTNAFTASDVTLLDAIGWNTTNSPPPPPTTVVSSVATSGSGIVNGTGDLNAGKVITLTLHMSQVVTVSSGAPTLTLNDGGVATYISGSGTAALSFNYIIAQGQNTPDLQVMSFNLNGSHIIDGGGNNPDFSSAATNPSGILQVDTIAPVVSSVVTSGAGIINGNGDLGSGRVITLSVNMSETVSVAGGTPTLTLNDGGVATYTGGSGGRILTFTDTVAQGQNTADLQISKFNLNGAAIVDGAGNVADFSGAATNPTGILQIDTASPTLTSIVESPSSGILTVGESATIALGFSEAVLVAGGIPTLALNDGGIATYQSGSNTSSLVFGYPVNAQDSNASSLAVASIHLGTATISDGAGNLASLSLPGLSQTGPQVETINPTVTHVTTSPSNGTLDVGDLVTITVALNEAVTVTGGTPTLILNDGGIATYDAHSSTATSLVFDYTIGATDQTTDLAIVAVREATGTTVRDIIGHDADFSNAIASTGTGLKIGTIANNTISGTTGNDTFFAFATNVAFGGDGGHDTLVFDGGRAQYSITPNGDGSVTVTDSVASRDFSHHVLNVEYLQFTDKTIFVENADDANIARLYSAAFDRAPDTGGLNGWEDIYAANISAVAKAGGVYLALAQTGDGFGTSIAGGFTQSAEFQSNYGSLSDSAFVNRLYLNVLNRAPDATELNAWLGLIHNGDASGTHYTHDMVLVGFAESPENIAKTGADWLIQI